MRRFIIAFSFFFSQNISAQELPATNWTHVGFSELNNPNPTVVSFMEFAEDLDESMSNDDILDEIIKSNSKGCVIFFKQGTYEFFRQIKLPSNFVLKGQGPELSHLTFNLSKEQDCILSSGKMTRNLVIVEDVIKGASSINLRPDIPKPFELLPGKFYYLADADEKLVTSTWSKGRTGQFVQIRKTDADKLWIRGTVRRDFLEQNHAVLIDVELNKWVGIEDLSIENKDATMAQTSNIKFELIENSWVKNVHSINGNYSHILLEYATNCEVEKCVIEKAHDYGNGGKAYGITLQFGTSNCLIGGNQLRELRHSILLQAGANGNVIFANKSTLPNWTDVRLPSDAAGDIVLHGNYPYANLFENNTCQTIVIDNSHGMNGPDNLFFNNKIYGYGIFMNRKSVSGSIAFIQNVIENKERLKGRYKIKGRQLEVYNKLNGKVLPKKSKPFENKKSFWLEY